jgi:XTP/dITP diphosphohydrolase
MKIFFATSNKHKFLEAKNILEKYGINIEMYPFKPIEIQSNSIEEIVKNCAKQIIEKKIKKKIFLEDAGLFIKSLKNFPGAYSSYVYSTIGLNGILKLMENKKNRNAIFKSAIAFINEKNKIKIFTGIAKGKIAYIPKGKKGFGFDPIFIPLGYNKTFAEMNIEEKNKVSHRGKAIIKMYKWLKKYYKMI